MTAQGQTPAEKRFATKVRQFRNMNLLTVEDATAMAVELAHAEALDEQACREQEAQVSAWKERHAGTPRRSAYWMIDAREADHAEAVKEAYDRWVDGGPRCSCIDRIEPGEGHDVTCPRRAHVIRGALGTPWFAEQADQADRERLQATDLAHDEALDEARARWLDGGPECVCWDRPLAERKGHLVTCPRRAYIVRGPVNSPWCAPLAEEAERDRLQAIEDAHADALIEDAGQAATVRELLATGGQCQYSAACGRTATTAMTHPVLGLLAVCERCDVLFARLVSRKS